MIPGAYLARLIALMVDQDFLFPRDRPVSIDGRNWTLILIVAVLVVVALSALGTAGMLVYALADLVRDAFRAG